MSNAVLLQGDCLEVLKELPDNSIESLVTDPPAGISFMGKAWDDDKGGSKEWIAWLTEVMVETNRVLKPGAHGLVWGLPRTSHWTASACEAAGFEIRDVITHLFGSGFPKSHNIEKSSGDERFKGFGTALKPASEHWILIRKPLEKGLTIAANALKWGVGGINIDASRVGNDSLTYESRLTANSNMNDDGWDKIGTKGPIKSVTGRFPANLLFSHNEDCMEVGVKQIGHGGPKTTKARTRIRNNGLGLGSETMRSGASGAPDNYGAETVSAWDCSENCAVAELDRQSGNLHASGNKKLGPAGKTDKSLFGIGSIDGRASDYKDSGGASRFFYCAKASKRDKGAENTHPTVKSTKLMSYLINMITPPNGTVLDPFLGSGTTGVSAINNGFRFIGIERESEYLAIAEARISNAENEKE